MKIEIVTKKEVEVPGLTYPILRRTARNTARRLRCRGNHSLKEDAVVEVALVSLQTIAQLNERHRGLDSPTDVLSYQLQLDAPFPTPFEEIGGDQVFGCVAICPDKARAQASEQFRSLVWEMAFLLCHGLLHLAGWNHPDSPSLTEMNKLSQGILDHVFA